MKSAFVRYVLVSIAACAMALFIAQSGVGF